MQITIPAATIGLPPAFFQWLTANEIDVPGVSAANPFHIDLDHELLIGTTVFGTEFRHSITVPLDDYLAGWLLSTFGEHDVEATPIDDMKRLYDQLGEARQAERDAKQRAVEARDQILARLRQQQARVGTLDGRPAVELKVIASRRFAKARFESDHPEMVDQYTDTTTSERLEIL
jgi:hypothetical protein